ncbi:DMT family transporter [Vibrio parahaemolyticus]|uniref:DMT family transporter n=1 Tax=Vibrio mediterranei TaxID=689 RepID=UPI0040688225
MSNITESQTESQRNQYVQGLAFALAGTALFSIKPVLVKIAYQYGGDATSIMALRAFTSLPFYVVILVLLYRDEAKRTQIKSYGWQGALVGVLGYYFASYLDIAALAHISAQLERLLIFLFPSIVVLFSWLFLGQRPTDSVAKAVVIGYAGIGLIMMHDLVSFGSDIWLGSLLAVASATVFAAYLMLSKTLIVKLGSDTFTSIGMGSAGVAILIHLGLSGVSVTEWSEELVGIGVLLGLFCTVLPSYLIAAGMARLSPTELSLTSNIGPGITAVMAVMILGEAFSFYHAMGLLLVTYSVYSMNKRK